MAPAAEDLLTPAETAIVSGAPLKEVYKVARERLPGRLVVRRGGKVMFRALAAVCVRIDHRLPKDVPVRVRKVFYSQVANDPKTKVLEHRDGLLSYVIDASAATKAVAQGLAAYRKAMALIVEDPDVQGGAATFRGTRILVHTIADLLKAGASEAELKEDYPNLTDAMLAAAPVHARARPKRGRPKAPAWRGAEPSSTRRVKRAAA